MLLLSSPDTVQCTVLREEKQKTADHTAPPKKIVSQLTQEALSLSLYLCPPEPSESLSFYEESEVGARCDLTV